MILDTYWPEEETVWGLRRGRILGKISFTVRNWTLFSQGPPEYLITVGFLGLSEKGPHSVRISDKGGGLHQVIPANFAVQGAATDL